MNSLHEESKSEISVLAKVYKLSFWALRKKAIKATDKGANILVPKLV